MTALAVAFGSAAKRTDSERQLLLLRRQVEDLDRSTRDLQEKLRWTESRYAQSRSLGRELNAALLQEQAKNRALTEQLRQMPHQGSDSSG